MDVSVIVVSYNTVNLLNQMQASLEVAMKGLDGETIYVDNASVDGSAEHIANSFPRSRLIINKINVGFGRANNQALPFATGRYVLLLNTDAFVAPDTLHKTLAYMDANPKCGILGVRLEGRGGELQPCARYFPTPLNQFLLRTGLNKVFTGVKMVDDMSWEHDSVRLCDWVVGCYYLVRKELIDTIGLFDPRYFLYFEEVDHCFAAKQAGWDVVFYPHTTVIHLGGESAKSDGRLTQGGKQLLPLQVESELLFFRKNYGIGAVLSNLTLTLLANAINVCKRILKRTRPFTISPEWEQSKLYCKLLTLTRFGSVPTR